MAPIPLNSQPKIPPAKKMMTINISPMIAIISILVRILDSYSITARMGKGVSANIDPISGLSELLRDTPAMTCEGALRGTDALSA